MKWYPSANLKGHTGSINCVDVVKTESDPDVIHIVSSSADGQIIVWTRRANGKWELKAKQSAGKACIYECISVAILNNTLIVAGGGLDNNIDVYAIPNITNPSMNETNTSELNEEEEKDVKQDMYTVLKLCTFEGHLDWVRSLDFHNINDKEILLASGSQDGYIRTWKVIHMDTDENDSDSGKDTNVIDIDGVFYKYNIEALLVGHSVSIVINE